MRISIELDEQLIRDAMRRTGATSKSAVIEAGLRLLVQIHSQTSIRKLRGRVRWEGYLAQSRLDKQPE